METWIWVVILVVGFIAGWVAEDRTHWIEKLEEYR